MTRNLYVLTIFLDVLILSMLLPFGRSVFIPAMILFVSITQFLRLKYLGLNGREILLTILLGPFTFLLGRHSDYWWRMWEKDN